MKKFGAVCGSGLLALVLVFSPNKANAAVIDLKKSDAAKEVLKFLHDNVSQGNERSEEIAKLEIDTVTKEFRGKLTVRHRHRILNKKKVLGKEIIIADITVYDLTQSAEFKYNLVSGAGTVTLNFGKLPGGNDILIEMKTVAKLPAVDRLKK